MINHKHLNNYSIFFLYLVIFYYSIKYNPLQLSLLDEITLYYNGQDGISGKLGSHLLNNLIVTLAKLYYYLKEGFITLLEKKASSIRVIFGTKTS